jgi:hypothetical protein
MTHDLLLLPALLLYLLQVVDGVIHFVSHLKGLFKGRYADVNRQDYQAVLSIIASKCTDIKGLAQLVNAPYEMLLKRKKAYLEFADKDHPSVCLHDLRSKERSDKLCPEWVAFSKTYFLPPWTRLGEKKRDHIRNRHDKNDTTLYNKAYFDDKPADVHAQMVINAKNKFGEDFHLSFRVWNYELRPFWACVCSRELCMCIHHLRRYLHIVADRSNGQIRSGPPFSSSSPRCPP